MQRFFAADRSLMAHATVKASETAANTTFANAMGYRFLLAMSSNRRLRLPFRISRTPSFRATPVTNRPSVRTTVIRSEFFLDRRHNSQQSLAM